MSDTCATCKYGQTTKFIAQFAKEVRLCRRNPPATTNVQTVRVAGYAHWPLVDDNDWCGEFVA